MAHSSVDTTKPDSAKSDEAKKDEAKKDEATAEEDTADNDSKEDAGKIVSRIIESLDESTLGHVWHSPGGDITLEFIATDYVRHLKHHLAQIGIEG